jgi:hypothetical protein
MKTKSKKVNTTGLPPVKRFLYSHVARILPYCFNKGKFHEGTCIFEHSPSSLENAWWCSVDVGVLYMTAQLETPREGYHEHNSKSSLSVKPRFIELVGERTNF